jgi:hypothetical protein
MPNPYITSTNVTLNNIKTDLAQYGGNFTSTYDDSSFLNLVINTFFANAGGTTYNLNAKASEWGITLQTPVASAYPAATASASGVVGPYAVTAQNTKLYLGKFVRVNADGLLDAGAKVITNVADPTSGNHVATKSYLDTLVNAQKARIDTLLAGSNTDLDTFAEVTSAVNTLSATGATNLLTATANLQKRQEVRRDVLPTISVISDSTVLPTVLPNAIKTNRLYRAMDGWYVTNAVASTKSNFYLPIETLPYSQILSLAIDVTHFNSPTSPVYVTFYSKPTASGNATDWYKAKHTYIVNDASSIEAFKDYSFWVSSAPTPSPNRTPLQLALDPDFSVGTILPEHEIYLIAIGTDSSATVGKLSCLIDQCKVTTPACTYVFNFSSATTELATYQASTDSALLTGNNKITALETKTTATDSALVTANGKITALENQVESLFQHFFQQSRTSTIFN